MGDDPVTPVYLCLEVAGCPTVCRHCWAQGTGYGMMPFADIEWVLARAHEYYDGRGLGFDSYPMHELAAYPDAAKLFSLFNLHGGTAAGGPFSSRGGRLGTAGPGRRLARGPGRAPGELARCADPTSTSTPAWRACTGPGTATPTGSGYT